ncbi:MAG: Xaa-Pro peptidase family protein [Bacteroidota bacterium]
MAKSKSSGEITIDERIKRLRLFMKVKKLDAYLISHIPSIRYFTGFSGSNATLIITDNDVHFFTDERYTEQIATELHKTDDLKTYIQRDVWGYIKDEAILKGIDTLAFESTRVSYSTAIHIRKVLKPIRLKPFKGNLDKLTIPKTSEEIANIQKAADIVSEVYDHILAFAKEGMRENEIAAEISYQCRRRGSQGDAFEIICVSGARGALIHGRASDKKLEKGDLVTLDFGAIVNGFNSDMTRTFAVGKPNAEQVNAYNLVLEAEQQAIAGIKAGVKAQYIDAIARGIIEEGGYGETFKHSTGHGLGIEVHESPGLSVRAKNDILPEHSVVTVEPGIYVGGKFGIRIEDDVLVTKDGHKVLTSARRDLVSV